MTALIVGVPSAAHRKALLRETAGGGRVPVLYVRLEMADALILSHPTDPEAGAMGSARLAWVAAGTLWPDLDPRPVRWDTFDGPIGRWVRLITDTDDVRGYWPPGGFPALATATNAAHAIGLVCVHLGLLERVERVEVPHGG